MTDDGDNLHCTGFKLMPIVLSQWWPIFLLPTACMYYPEPYVVSASTDIHHQVCLVDRTGSDGVAAATTANGRAVPIAAMQLHGRNSYLVAVVGRGSAVNWWKEDTGRCMLDLIPF